MSKTNPPAAFPPRRTDSHKGDFGRVLMVGGSRGMSGSIALSAMAALRTGSGLVSAAIPDRCLETVAGFHPGIMTIPIADTDAGCFCVSAKLPSARAYHSIGCGPGMGVQAGSIRIVESLLNRNDRPRVLDADAINVIAAHKMLDSPALPRDQHTLILTPHPGELARLSGVPAGDREAQICAAESLAREFGLTLVVKGGPTVVVGRASADRPVDRYENPTGNPGMATAGSGDVLTGVITSLAGQGLSPWDAARLGVFIHGLAGDIAAEKNSQSGMTCLELLHSLPAAIASL